MNKRAVGTRYESLAAAYLTGQGCRILKRNYRCRWGEIDLIAEDGRFLIFVEVKYRAGERCGSAAEAVDFRKRRQIIRVAGWYLMEHHLPDSQPCRFDVIAVDKERLTWYQDAFACG